MGRPSSYNPQYHDDWAWSLAVKGATMQEIADAFHLSKRQVERWNTEHESFHEALESGRDVTNARVEKNLYKLAMGYEYTEEETIVEMDTNGNPRPIKIRKMKKYSRPSLGAMAFWLKNREPDKWKDNPKNEDIQEALSKLDILIQGIDENAKSETD